MYESKKRLLPGVLLTVLIISSFFVGFFVGSDELESSSIPATDQEGAGAEISFSPFWKTWQTLNEKHIDANEVDSEQRLWSSIEGLAASFNDPYTVFFPPKESKEFQEEISGNFEGVGMEVGIKEERITVVAPLKGTPAEEAGVEPGDLILGIDGVTTFGMTIDEAVDLIRGERGTTVTLTLLREGEEKTRDISIIREKIQIPTLETENRKDGVFIISLYNFSANVQNEFKQALSEFAISGSNKLIIDVRGNPGGYLDASVEIASYFLPSGKVIVREVGSGGEELDVFRSRGYDILTGNDIEVIVLINQGSASASEILAGALRENGVATLVGEATFGKGSVQEVVQITPETTLKVTIAEWLTPNGISISEGGLEPDILVEYEPNEEDPEYDNQLLRAVEILLNN
ncbi:MAG: S41 family peptidase [Candidatus Paceibacterota bacterium]